MNPAALLPNERLCPTCHGEKVLECSGVHPKRPNGGITAMESPDYWTEPCPNPECDGKGVVLNERRAAPRDAADELVTQLINTITFDRDLWRAKYEGRGRVVQHQAQQIDQLILENRRYREAIDKAARVIGRRVTA